MEFLQLGEQPPLSIVFEDKSLIAVNKPAGQLFHGYTHGTPTTLVDQVKEYIRSRSGKTEGIYLGVVHRLDRPVSGLSLFARNSKIAQRVAEQFQERTLDKIYLAVVEGEDLPDADTLEDELEGAENPGESKLLKCQLSYQRLARAGGLSLVAIRLGSGRRHQIRIQFSKRGWPLVGDTAYGAQSVIVGTEGMDPRFQAIALHATALHLSHPLSYTPLKIQAPLPFYWPRLGASLQAASEAYRLSLA